MLRIWCIYWKLKHRWGFILRQLVLLLVISFDFLLLHSQNEYTDLSWICFGNFGRRRRRGGRDKHIYLYLEEKVRGIGEICQQQGNHFNLVSDRIIWQALICWWLLSNVTAAMMAWIWHYMKLSKIKCGKLLLGAKLSCFSKISKNWILKIWNLGKY